MTPAEEWAREARRSRRWESAHRWFVFGCALAVAAGVAALQLYREYLIWFR